ncbi:glycogen synthase [Streptomyces sp. NPDC002285]
MTIAMLTREYPPYVYGGAGEHVGQLAQRLRRRISLDVHCFGAPRPESSISGHAIPPALGAANPALQAIAISAPMAHAAASASAVHSHTWYANFAGHLAKTIYEIPHIVTAHTVEPCRPWKEAQLRGGYALSSFLERTSLLAADRIIAVSQAMRIDLLDAYPDISPDRIIVIHNGVDGEQFVPDSRTNALVPYHALTDRKLVVSVARITPQKGLKHLLRAAHSFSNKTSLVIVADSWDSEALRNEFASAVAAARRAGVDVHWISQRMPRPALVQLLSHANVFVAPSIYEPLGIVNLEAMACGTAVVSTAVGGIPEVVLDGVTGLLVPIDVAQAGEPSNPERFAMTFADRVNEVLSDENLADRMGKVGRQRVLEHFTWESVAQGVLNVYRGVL